jgi:hypothetical protein
MSQKRFWTLLLGAIGLAQMSSAVVFQDGAYQVVSRDNIQDALQQAAQKQNQQDR